MQLDFNKIKTFFFQFSLLNAIRFSCAELVRKILDSYNIPSYSMTGEDRILCHLLNQMGPYGKTGFYVEIGCNHPQKISNTFVLYKRGWSGICIDANEEIVQNYQKLRKRDLSICAVISDKEQELIFTEFEDSGLSSLNLEHVNKWQKHTKIKGERVVNTVLLTVLLNEYNIPKDFELLCIDVEGHDFEVLSSLSFDKYRPKMIAIEMHEFDFLNPSSNNVYQHLTNLDYKMIGYVTMNGYFSDNLAKSL